MSAPHDTGPRPNHWRETLALAAFAAALTLLSSCRGHTSTDPPWRVIADMVSQPKATPHTLTLADRLRKPDGVIALEQNTDATLATAGSARGEPLPVRVSSQVLLHGQQRFEIYCSPCHDRFGTAQGVVAKRGFPAPTDLTLPEIRKRTDRELFESISSGVRNMPAMAEQITLAQRWEIVAWIRVLQERRNARVSELEDDQRASFMKALGGS